MLKVGIIDSGYSAEPDVKIHSTRSFHWFDGGVVSSDTDHQDQLGHGSALTKIIAYPSSDVKLVIAKVFFDKLICTPAQIAAALDWQITQGARLINMSFGLHSDRPILKAACQRALKAGAILVAAAPARGKPVYPAAYEGVIRATGDARCEQVEISYLNSPQADFGGHVRAHNSNIAGASIGCAHVTSAFIQILLQNPDLDRADLFDRLISQARYRGPENRSFHFSRDVPHYRSPQPVKP